MSDSFNAEQFLKELNESVQREAEDSKHLTPEEMQAKYNHPKEWYTKYQVSGFEYEFQPHHLFRCNKTCWCIKDVHGIKYATGSEQNGKDVFDRCHAAVKRMIAFLSNTDCSFGELVSGGVIYHVDNDWICIGISRDGYKIAHMADTKEMLLLGMKNVQSTN